jgi:hypothetical protein
LVTGQIRGQDFQLENFLGDWKGVAIAAYDGQKIRATGTSSVKKIGGNYYISSEVRIPNFGTGTASLLCESSGNISGETRLIDGTVLSSVKGTWYHENASVYISISQETDDIYFTQTIIHTLVGTDRMISTSNTSYGAEIYMELSRLISPVITSDLSTVSVPIKKLIPRFTITTNFGAKTFAAKGLPKGLKLNTKTGVVSGKPTKAGTYTVTLTARKMKGKKVEQQATATKVVIVY